MNELMNYYLMPDNEILLLFHEEGIELLDLTVQQVDKLLLGPPVLPPSRQGLLDLLLQTLPELHGCLRI